MSEIINNEGSNFIEDIINKDLASGKVKKIATRFPPEPNGCLHIGHAKAVCLDFTTAEKYGGTCNLRYDDTNPVKEDTMFVKSIEEDIKWLGFKWDKLIYASDYFEEMYKLAVKLIEKGKAYVCDLNSEEIRATRGNLTEKGKESPNRNRSVEENLLLFQQMREGKFQDGEKVLRAKIDMASPNLNMRDPVIYRILRATHHNTGDKWCIYPMYDFAHPLEDAMENITHSFCTLEFEDHRPLYDWFVKECEFSEPHPQQIEFARLEITNTVMSKRFLKQLVDQKKVSGWDDPRMPTLAGLRRRGVPPMAIRDFVGRIGVSKANSEVEVEYLNSCIRDHLNKSADRVMAVFDPLEVEITNFSGSELCSLENNPNSEVVTYRDVTFSNRIYIDRSDFYEIPPPKYHRLKPNGVVRLKGAYIIQCDEVVKDQSGQVVKLLCSAVANSKSGNDTSGVKAKGVIQWVDANNCLDIEVRQIGSMLVDATEEKTDFISRFDENSLEVVSAKCEMALKEAKVNDSFQFMRIGYYAVDPDSTPDKLVFNQTVGLKDGFKAQSK